MKEIPGKIYLQIYDEWGDELEERTWCEDQINESDAEYIQQDRDKIKSLAVVLRTLAKAALELTDELTKKGG